jgi:hypothetical protein
MEGTWFVGGADGGTKLEEIFSAAIPIFSHVPAYVRKKGLFSSFSLLALEDYLRFLLAFSSLSLANSLRFLFAFAFFKEANLCIIPHCFLRLLGHTFA